MKATVTLVTAGKPMSLLAVIGERVDTDDLLRAGYELALEDGMIYATHSRAKWDWLHAEAGDRS